MVGETQDGTIHNGEITLYELIDQGMAIFNQIYSIIFLKPKQVNPIAS